MRVVPWMRDAEDTSAEVQESEPETEGDDSATGAGDMG